MILCVSNNINGHKTITLKDRNTEHYFHTYCSLHPPKTYTIVNSIQFNKLYFIHVCTTYSMEIQKINECHRDNNVIGP